MVLAVDRPVEAEAVAAIQRSFVEMGLPLRRKDGNARAWCSAVSLPNGSLCTRGDPKHSASSRRMCFAPDLLPRERRRPEDTVGLVPVDPLRATRKNRRRRPQPGPGLFRRVIVASSPPWTSFSTLVKSWRIWRTVAVFMCYTMCHTRRLAKAGA